MRLIIFIINGAGGVVKETTKRKVKGVNQYSVEAEGILYTALFPNKGCPQLQIYYNSKPVSSETAISFVNATKSSHNFKIDPIELRIRNEPARDPESGLPWSSRSLIECFKQGAARFNWSKRKPEPRSMRDGPYLISYGVASATYPTRRRPARARAQVLADGSVRVQIAATDLGTGTYTILTQIAADALGVSPDRVVVEIGDSNLQARHLLLVVLGKQQALVRQSRKLVQACELKCLP